MQGCLSSSCDGLFTRSNNSALMWSVSEDSSYNSCKEAAGKDKATNLFGKMAPDSVGLFWTADILKRPAKLFDRGCSFVLITHP